MGLMFHDFPNPPSIKSYKIINQQGSWDGDLQVPLKNSRLLLRVLLDELREAGALHALEGLQLAVLVHLGNPLKI